MMMPSPDLSQRERDKIPLGGESSSPWDMIFLVGDYGLFEELSPLDEALEAFFSEFGKAAGGLLDGFLLVEVCLGEEFVGIADDLFLEGFGQQTLVG